MSQGQPPLALVLLALRRIGASEGQHAWLRGQLARLRVPMVRGNTSTKSVPRRHAGHKLGDRANPQATGVKDALMDSKWQSSKAPLSASTLAKVWASSFGKELV